MRRRLAFSAEIICISALILITRCANYGDVFFGGQINFVDPDCYARMTRARICFEHPGTIVRRHDFENFPIGTYPHTTAPFDYLIVATATVLKPLTGHPLDLAGAIVSPLLSVALGIFLCWWSRNLRIQFRWGLLILYAVSPILAHGFALGRPDHQSLLIALVTVALCAEWSETRQPSKGWGIVSGAGWALAVWVSLYEPVILLLLVIVFRRGALLIRERRMGWLIFALVLAIAFLLERRVPHWPGREFDHALKNWSATIGELSHVSLGNPIWFNWCGWLLLAAPIVLWPQRNRSMPWFFKPVLTATFGLTVWQARWAYFFVVIFAMTVPELLYLVRKPLWAAAAFVVALFPIAQAWDRTFSAEELTRRAQNDVEMVELHSIALQCDGPFMAPWWFSPALSYWSGHAGVGGSSHESIGGVVASAKVFGTENTEEVAQVLRQSRVKWIVAYDADRVAQNSSQILQQPFSPNAFCYLLDRHSSQGPPFLRLIAQTSRFKLFRVLNP